jgi:Flp pilus assembly protein TadG
MLAEVLAERPEMLAERAASYAASAASARGSVFIEFILVCPILLALIGYSLRLTQLLHAHQIAMTISREAATEAFRQCIDISLQSAFCASSRQLCLDMTNMQTATVRCLDRLKTKYTAQWPAIQPAGTVNPSFSIDLEVYRYDMDSVSLDCTSAPTSSRKSRLSTSSQIPELFTTQQELTSLCQRNRVARARVAFKLAPTAAFLRLNGEVLNQQYDIIDDTTV